MLNLDISTCKVTVFVCTNERPTDKVCCKKVGGQEFYQLLKDRVRNLGLQNSHWICRTGCLGFCNAVGTTVAIYKPGEKPRWFNEIQVSDIESIWKEVHS